MSTTVVNGWTILTFHDGASWRVRAISPDRKLVVNRDHLTAEQAATFDPSSTWSTPRPAPSTVVPVLQP